MESFVFSEVNKAMRERDMDKMEMFGPFVNTLCFIISVAQHKNKKKLSKGGFKTYRGLILDKFTFDQEYNSANQIKYLNGLTSTTLDREVALEFAINM